MPKLDNIIANRKKGKFKKKEYRPWDLAGNSADTEASAENDKPKEDASSTRTGDNTGNKQDTTRQQTDNTEITRKNGLGNNQITTREQLDNHTEHQSEDETGNKKYFIETIKKLAGIQKNIFLYVLNISLTHDQLDTDNMLTRELAEAVGASYGSTKTSIKRLVDKKVLIRNKGKACRCGHINLGITKTVRLAALEAYKNNLSSFSGNKTDNTIGNNGSHSSSIYNNNITTTNLPEEWNDINFESIKHIGFSRNQLYQLYEKKLNVPDVIQESINHLAFGLENNEKTQKYPRPLNVFMGVLRRGMAWHEGGYESPQDIALKNLLALKKEQQEKRKNQLDDLFKACFEPWYEQQSDEALKKALPAPMRNTFRRSNANVLAIAKDEFKSTDEWQSVLITLQKPTNTEQGKT